MTPVGFGARRPGSDERSARGPAGFAPPGLHEHEVEYVLLGALAMVFYGYVRNTEDLDIVISGEPENLDRVTDWLRSVDARLKLNPSRLFGARERCALQKGSNATVLTSLGQVDVVPRLPGLPEWPKLIREAEVYEIEGMRVQVINRRTLIDLKRSRGSNLDLADIAAIELLPAL